MENTLNIAEKFYSVQCEGHTTGVPAYFIRLKGCNLSCGLNAEDMKKIQPQDVIETGSLVKSGKATWACDSASVWKFGKKTQYKEIYEDWDKRNISNWINNGRIHIIWTGGEPTLIHHQNDIINFIEDAYKQNRILHAYHEVETNGTQKLLPEFSNIINQINCSVKLKNSGMQKQKRIVPEALNSILKHKNYWFKFVISNELDIQEIESDFILPFSIDTKRVILMPGLCKQENFHERTKFVLETAKKYGYLGLSRLHISAWNLSTSV